MSHWRARSVSQDSPAEYSTYLEINKNGIATVEADETYNMMNDNKVKTYKQPGDITYKLKLNGHTRRHSDPSVR